jgi:hypothetical protein
LESISQTRILGSKRLLSFGGALCVSLAFMVFAWGTNYKLSLYKTGHETSPAKLCTRGSDAAKNAMGHTAGARTLAPTPLRIAALFSHPRETKSYPADWLSSEAICDLSPLRRAPILYLRPPPDKRRWLD